MSTNSNKRLPTSPADSTDSTKKRIVDTEIVVPGQVLAENGGGAEDQSNMQKHEGQENEPQQVDGRKINQILEVVSFLKNKATDTDKTIHDKCEALEKAQAELLDKITDNTSKIQSSKIETEATEEKVSRLLSRLAEFDQEFEQVNEKLTKALNRIDILESRADLKDREFVDLSTEVKERKLVISGIPEFTQEKIFVTVVSSINKLINTANTESPTQDGSGGKFNAISRADIIHAYRIGRFKKGTKRNIIVSCATNEVKHRIMSAKSLTKNSKVIKFYINDDQNLATRVYKSKLWRINEGATKLGLDSKVVGNRIIIEGQSYAQNELDLIPRDVIYASRQERDVPHGIAFRGEDSIFSNFYPCNIVIGGERFSSVEQYFQYCRAIDHGLAQLSKKIMCTNDPAAQKVYGDRAEDSAGWKEKCEHVLYVGVYAKFSQSDELRAKLLESGNRKLYEATKDNQFGCRLGLKSEKWTTSKFNGGNAQGVILMKVRDELREKFGISVEVDMEIPPENTLADLATQTLVRDGSTEDGTEVKDMSSMTLEGWLGESGKSDYELNYPYLAKAKSPQVVYSTHVSDRRSSKSRGRKSGPASQNERNPPAGGDDRRDDRKHVQNKQDKTVRKNSRGGPTLTSTPARSQATKQGKEHEVLTKVQKDILRKNGIEPSSDFVLNLMRNHHII